MGVVVYLSLALMCIGPDCHSVLVGKTTPPGEYKLIQRQVSDPLYGGSVLQFSETDATVFAIHRVWLGRPHEKRLERIHNSNAKERVITNGCINVESHLYDRLLSCCQGHKLIILP